MQATQQSQPAIMRAVSPTPPPTYTRSPQQPPTQTAANYSTADFQVLQFLQFIQIYQQKKIIIKIFNRFIFIHIGKSQDLKVLFFICIFLCKCN